MNICQRSLLPVSRRGPQLGYPKVSSPHAGNLSSTVPKNRSRNLTSFENQAHFSWSMSTFKYLTLCITENWVCVLEYKRRPKSHWYYICIFAKARGKWVYASEKKCVKSPMCAIESEATDWTRAFSIVRHSGILLTLDVIHCGVLKWSCAIAKSSKWELSYIPKSNNYDVRMYY